MKKERLRMKSQVFVHGIGTLKVDEVHELPLEVAETLRAAGCAEPVSAPSKSAPKEE